MSHDLLNTLKAKGLKATPARLAIFELFSSDCEPINAEHILKKLKNKKINLVTIYRTLTSFEKAGILKRTDLQKTSVHYEAAGHHHHHIVCTDCGKTESFDTCKVDKISLDVLKNSSMFANVNQHSLELFGVCKSCLEK